MALNTIAKVKIICILKKVSQLKDVKSLKAFSVGTDARQGKHLIAVTTTAVYKS